MHVVDELVGTIVVEPHPVNQRLRTGQAKHARLCVARLRPWGYGSHFDEAESEASKRIDMRGGLVEACARPTGLGKFNPITLTGNGLRGFATQRAMPRWCPLQRCQC